MGRTVKILKNKKVKPSLCNTRFTVELCENVHMHYRNIRLEFKKEEFLHILSLLSKIDRKKIENFPYNDYNFELLVEDFDLPSSCEYNNRLQIELQKEGHYHIHYRNCRLEFKMINEIGLSKINFLIPLLQLHFTRLYQSIQKRLFKYFYNRKKTVKLLCEKLKSKVDPFWAKDFCLKIPFYRHYSIKPMPLSSLKAVLFVKEGTWIYPLYHCPHYRYLNGDKEAYRSYCVFKDKKEGKDMHNEDRFQRLLTSLKKTKKLEHFIVVNRKNEILDGLHRACYLLYKHGPKHEISVLKIWW